MPIANDGQLLSFILGGTAVAGIIFLLLGIAEKVRNLRTPAKTEDEQFVTKGEFKLYNHNILEKVKELDTFTRTELNSLKTDLLGKVEKVESYLHSSNHDRSNTMQALVSKVERLLAFNDYMHPEFTKNLYRLPDKPE